MQGISAAAKPTFLFWQWRIRLFVELLINLPPTWKTAEVAVVDEEVCVDFPAYIGGVRGFFWVGTVYGIRRDTVVLHELYGVLKFGAVAVGPKNEAVAVVLEHLEGFYRERLGFTYPRVFVFDNGAVEIYCYEEALTHPWL